MKILITGGAGFIGSNFIRFILNKYPYYEVVNLDKLTYAGNLETLQDIKSHSGYTFIEGDIINAQLVERIVKEHHISIMINFAAESHVDRSIERPHIFTKTNVLGAQVLLDAALQHGIQKFIQISTDEVYGSLGDVGYFTEETKMAPNSPYAASKAAADLLVKSYYQTYKMNINITRCSNNYGPYQFPEKLIPLTIKNAIENKNVTVYGNGLNVRDWLHVQDHCSAIDLVLHKGVPGEIYNIGDHNEQQNIELVKEILGQLGKTDELINYVEDRKGHDWRYAIDPSKIKQKLGWAPIYTFNEGLTETINWYLNNEQWWRNVVIGERVFN